MNIATSYNTLKNLSAAANEEELEISERTLQGNGMLVGSPASIEYMKAPRPHNAALITFVNDLPDSEVQTFTALLYAGRDGMADVPALWHDMKSDFSAIDEARRAIIEKHPRIEYMEAALQRSPILGLEEIHKRIHS